MPEILDIPSPSQKKNESEKYSLSLADRKLQQLTAILDADSISKCTTFAYGFILEAYEYAHIKLLEIMGLGEQKTFPGIAQLTTFSAFWLLTILVRVW